MATVGTKLYTWLYGHRVGEDDFGNVYYEAKSTPKQGRRKRWVMYKGIPEASKVPAIWHGWLHYTHEQPLKPEEAKRYSWQKEHLPNLTGTKYAYAPPGHASKGGQRVAVAADYQAWKP